MLQLLPWVVWLATITSIGLLVVLFRLGELGPRALVLLGAWWLAAAYQQFFGRSALATAAGLVLQTVLAVYLIMRWRFSGV